MAKAQPTRSEIIQSFAVLGIRLAGLVTQAVYEESRKLALEHERELVISTHPDRFEGEGKGALATARVQSISAAAALLRQKEWALVAQLFAPHDPIFSINRQPAAYSGTKTKITYQDIRFDLDNLAEEIRRRAGADSRFWADYAPPPITPLVPDMRCLKCGRQYFRRYGHDCDVKDWHSSPRPEESCNARLETNPNGAFFQSIGQATLHCHLKKGHDGIHRGRDAFNHDHSWPQATKPMCGDLFMWLGGTNGCRCTQEPGHTGAHGNGTRAWITATKGATPPRPEDIYCANEKDDKRCVRKAGHKGQHASADDFRWK
jgi:hypothetical protein